jgi:hypothetical protein
MSTDTPIDPELVWANDRLAKCPAIVKGPEFVAAVLARAALQIAHRRLDERLVDLQAARQRAFDALLADGVDDMALGYLIEAQTVLSATTDVKASLPAPALSPDVVNAALAAAERLFGRRQDEVLDELAYAGEVVAWQRLCGNLGYVVSPPQTTDLDLAAEPLYARALPARSEWEAAVASWKETAARMRAGTYSTEIVDMCVSAGETAGARWQEVLVFITASNEAVRAANLARREAGLNWSPPANPARMPVTA